VNWTLPIEKDETGLARIYDLAVENKLIVKASVKGPIQVSLFAPIRVKVIELARVGDEIGTKGCGVSAVTGAVGATGTTGAVGVTGATGEVGIGC
jgi:hypothetical protein